MPLGGINSPLIISYPNSLPQNRIVSEFSSVVDITPTILELVSASHPGTQFQGRLVHGMDGL